jgi:hypothetical protein
MCSIHDNPLHPQQAPLPRERLRPWAVCVDVSTHSKKQIQQIALSVEKFEVIAGHGRLEAAKKLGLTHSNRPLALRCKRTG